jgi:glucose-6-phosphate 1-dehydrogenase
MPDESSIQVTARETSADAAVLKVDQPSTVVILGATGDLTSRKLIPALFNLYREGYLPEHFDILGVARRDLGDAVFRDMMHDALLQYGEPPPSEAQWDEFVSALHYQALVFDDVAGYARLAERVHAIEHDRGTVGQRLFYLATDPMFFSIVPQLLRHAGLVRPIGDKRCCSVVIEKPFGHDLESAIVLNREVKKVLDEDQTYRIDHYLGKDTVQNLLAFRFGNAIFDPLLNNKYVDHVQITMAESIGMAGRRGAFYDNTGALRDVFQNHILQLLSLFAMEPPAVLGSKEIRDEKVKVLQSLTPLTADNIAKYVVRGQYTKGKVDGNAIPAYRHEEGVHPQSQTETYVAVRTGVDNWRWSGVPFLLRTGKCLADRVTEIAVQFKDPPMHYFTNVECVGEVCDISEAKPNVLVFRIQPNEGMSLTFSAKRPGMLLQTHAVDMDFVYGRAFAIRLPEAYERLLLDALRGDSTLFMRSDEVRAAWQFVDQILRMWSRDDAPPLCFYPAGSWGPVEADNLIAGCGAEWRKP